MDSSSEVLQETHDLWTAYDSAMARMHAINAKSLVAIDGLLARNICRVFELAELPFRIDPNASNQLLLDRTDYETAISAENRNAVVQVTTFGKGERAQLISLLGSLQEWEDAV